MHERAVAALDQRAATAALAGAVAARWPTATVLDAEGLAARFPNRSLVAGWKLPAAAINGPCDLVLALPSLFPNALPLVALAERPSPGIMPHVEVDGVVCLASGGTLLEFPVDIRHAEFIVSDAVAVINAGLAGDNRDDFLDEISTYWTLGQPASSVLLYFLRSLGGTKPLHALMLSDAAVLSESKEALATWTANVRPAAAKNPVKRSAVIHLPKPVFPDDYPTHTGELFSLVDTAGARGVELVADAITPGEQTPLLLAFEHRGNLQFLGVRVNAGTRIGTGHGSRTFWDGYRKGHMPRDEFVRRMVAARFPVIRTDAVRVDSDFLLHRTTGPSAISLSNVKVAVIGCGALGAQVVHLLAQAGIRRLTLVDHDALSWQNVGRHVLTGKAVGRNKASAMREEVLSRFPDYEVDAIPLKWQDNWKAMPDVFDKHDLVISLTADWLSDSLLNALSKQGDNVPPVIFSWLEAHGLAGHLVAVLPEGGCLRCLMNPLGEFQHPVAVVPVEHALQRESSCGAFYQPFSAVSVAPLAAQVVKSAINALSGRTNSSEHQIWVGAKEDFDTVDATVTADWLTALTEHGFERVYRTQLPSTVGCPVCQPAT